MELARNLKIDSVSRLRPAPPLLLESTCPVATAVEMMRGNREGCVLVCDEHRKLIGVFTDRDLLRRVIAMRRAWTTPVGEVMTSEPVAVAAKDPVRTALHRMQKGNYRHLPVVDEGGRPVGMVSVRKIVHFVVEHFPATVYNLPPDPRAWPTMREGA